MFGPRALVKAALLLTFTSLVLFTLTSQPAIAATREITVGAPLAVPPIPAGFVGLSLEYYELAETLGPSTGALNPVFSQLVRMLDPGQPPSIRIGGESADWTWVPTPGVKRPAPINETLTNPLVAVLAATARNLDARYLLDLNLAADNSRLTGHEGRTLYRGIGASYIRAEEIGNEPELYDALSWSRPPLPVLRARPIGYGVESYESEFDRMAQALPAVPTAGPAVGNTAWATAFSTTASHANRLSLITIHRYALQRCGLHPGDKNFPTVTKLMSPAASFGLADSIEPVVAAAHAHHLPVRVDEVNSAPCFGVAGVSNSFASALWSLQTTLALARTGVDGINFHTEPAAAHRLFNFWRTGSVWHASVFPGFYGLLMFAWAAPPGSRMLAARGGDRTLTAWATARDGTERVVLVDTGAAQTVDVHVPGTRGAGQLARLIARSPYATGGMSIAGTAIPQGTTTGQLSPGPQSQTVSAAGPGSYRLRVTAHSAVLLTLKR